MTLNKELPEDFNGFKSIPQSGVQISNFLKINQIHTLDNKETSSEIGPSQHGQQPKIK